MDTRQPPSTISAFCNRIETIEDICDGKDTTYQTDYPNIVKLCRDCIADICTELVTRTNFETLRFKRYTQEWEHPTMDDPSFREELAIDIDDAKYNYNRYYNLYQELRNKRLYTKACVVCGLGNIPVSTPPT